MIRSILISVLFVASSFGLSCGSVAQDRNVTFSVNYVYNLNQQTYFYDLTIFNSLPGVVYPNDAVSRISFVNTFAFANYSSGGLVNPAHMNFWALNGGASNTQRFSVPRNYTGEGRCLTIGFAYKQFGFERYFLESFELTRPSGARAVEEEVALQAEEVNNAADGSLQARAYGGSCPPFVFTSGGFNSFSGLTTGNTYYLKANATAYTSVSVSMSCPADGSLTFYLNTPGPNWATWASNSVKYGNVGINAPAAGTYQILVSVSYSCSAGTGWYTYYNELIVTNSGGKRSIQGADSASAAPLATGNNFSLVVASIGTATACVALAVAVVAVVVVRRRSYSPISA